jgi:hypothetical protein
VQAFIVNFISLPETPQYQSWADGVIGHDMFHYEKWKFITPLVCGFHFNLHFELVNISNINFFPISEQ